MKLVAIDPSFSRTGIAILDVFENKIIFKQITLVAIKPIKILLKEVL